MKNNPFGFRVADIQGLGKVPGNGFAFPVFIGCENHIFRFFGEFLQGIYGFPRFGRNYVRRLEIMLFVDAELAFRKIADVAVRGLYLIILAEKFAYRFCLCRGFNDY